jgi:hypothetical protein
MLGEKLASGLVEMGVGSEREESLWLCTRHSLFVSQLYKHLVPEES